MTAALEGGEWSAARTGRTLPRERPGTHCTGGWVDPRAGLRRAENIYVHICLLDVRISQSTIYRVRQKYLTIWQHSCEWNRWRGGLSALPARLKAFQLPWSSAPFQRDSKHFSCHGVLHPSSETQSISVVMECWSVEHPAFAVETYF